MKIRLNDLKCSEYWKCEFLVKKHIWSVKLLILKPLPFASKCYTSVPTQHKVLIMQYLKKLYSFAPPLSIIKIKLLTYTLHILEKWIPLGYKCLLFNEKTDKILIYKRNISLKNCFETAFIFANKCVILLLFKWKIKFPI